jgi:hypothetical protein
MKLFCNWGWHRFQPTGWAQRACKGCGLFQINLYENGEAEWQEPPADWVAVDA